MPDATLRQVGGSVMVAIPPVLLEQLNLSARSTVGIAVEQGRIVLEPKSRRPRWTLDELLAQCDSVAPPEDTDVGWTSAPPHGGELV